MRVFIAVDGSEGSFEAIRQVAPLLRPDRDQLALFCRPPQVRVGGNQTDEVLAKAREALAGAIFAEADKHLPAQWSAKRETIVGHHDPRHGIVVAAEQWEAELIVMGARGLSMFERLLLGSVSRAVVHASKVPVWIARPRSQAGQARRVLLACENAQWVARPAELLGKLSWPAGSRFTLLTICTSMFAGRVPDWLQQQARSPDVEELVQNWVREHDAEVQGSLTQLQQATRRFPVPLDQAQSVVLEGEPGHLILQQIAAEQDDLVVIGAYRKRTLATAIFGSTSEAVLNHAGCSVLVVPHPETP
jgi:nucleotide-binding universal stress UspA family protein